MAVAVRFIDDRSVNFPESGKFTVILEMRKLVGIFVFVSFLLVRFFRNRLPLSALNGSSAFVFVVSAPPFVVSFLQGGQPCLVDQTLVLIQYNRVVCSLVLRWEQGFI